VSPLRGVKFKHMCLALGTALGLLSACTSLPSPDAPQEYLDKDSAATISVAGRPLVFARERPESAAHMRDYVTVAAAAVDQNGKTDYVVIAYFWSTLDRHGERAASLEATGRPAPHDEIVFAADDRRITLRLNGHSAREMGIGVPVHAPPARSATPNVYRVDLPTLRFMALARHLAVVASPESETSYELWDDQRTALASFVASLSGQ
jgi:hypothetical protein